MEITSYAYPKINIHLAVGTKRSDGFHEIASVFQLVKDYVLRDKITIKVSNSQETSIVVKGLDGIADPVNNTVYKAVDLFLKQAKVSATVEVDLEKNIPSQAGLGGGSSDAATVLLSLNKMFPISFENLLKIAQTIGSDVPFFVYECEAAVVTGRGENVYPLKSRKLKISLYPTNGEKMSTSKAYSMLDARKTVAPLQSVEELTKMYYGAFSDWKFYNDFEILYKKPINPYFKLTGSGTCRYTIDLIES